MRGRASQAAASSSALSPAPAKGQTRAVTLLTDRWVFACRLPAGTAKPASAADLAAGRLVVPALAPPLIEQADRYFAQNKMSSVRFVNEHPGELPRLIDDYPDAALFVPESLISHRLGFLRVKTVAPVAPLKMNIVARVPAPNAATALFIRHLRRALAGPARVSARRPTISLRQIHYFNMVYRLRRVSAAAHGANVTQPALSEQLHKLERTLSSQAVRAARRRRHSDRRRRLFRQRGEDDRGRLPSRHRRRRGAAAPLSRRIAIGILPSVSQHGHLVNRITEAVLGVQARHPALKLVVQEAPNGTLQDWVMRGLVGVAIVETGLPHMPRLPLGSSEGLAAVAHASHKLLPPGPVKFADLLRLPLGAADQPVRLAPIGRNRRRGTRPAHPALYGDRRPDHGGRRAGARAGLHGAAAFGGAPRIVGRRTGRTSDRRSNDRAAAVRHLFR